MATNKPSRPSLQTQQSASLPATPNQRAFDHTPISRSPSFHRNASNSNPTPHSSNSMAFPRIFNGGCKYETGMANAKRRVPYSLGPDKLDPDPEAPKRVLTHAEDSRLTTDMQELYRGLLPTPASEERRKTLVEKLQLMLQEQWPAHTITVNVFGSTGNKLSATDSDVDICITTDCKELELVCVLADLLANRGMQRVVCVSVAKVPIVKIWDPELRLACDLNVNNPVALENTEMIRTYVEIDERVRPLAMIVKHWTKRRVLNEAALGGTLSSYTWICMIINFLQTRDSPVLPSLQQAPNLEEKIMCGLNVAFDKRTAPYQGFGSRNKDSLGNLLFQFFRYYGHEINFEASVMSVRAGKVIAKSEKNWHFLQDNRLCVEEPFNTSRNLGNTADDTSVRGIHLELRRAFAMVSGANLSRCCAEYEPPASLVDESRPSERQTLATNRPILANPAQPPSRMTRGGSRGGRGGNQPIRGISATRRASNPSSRSHALSQPLPVVNNGIPAEFTLQAQQHQHFLHDRLFRQYQFLQAQEQELRAQLHQQAVFQGRILSTSTYPQFLLPRSAGVGSQEEAARMRSGTLSQPPLTAPLRSQGFSVPFTYEGRSPTYAVPGISTNPPSPLLHSAFAETRRSYRSSSSTTASSGASLRAHSQPPRPVPSPLSIPISNGDHQTTRPCEEPLRSRRGQVFASSNSREFVDPRSSPYGRLYPTNSNPDRGGSEYIGYYIGHSPPLPMYSRSVASSPMISGSELGVQNGSISPQVFAQLSPKPLTTPSLSNDLAGPSQRERARQIAESNAEPPTRQAPTQANKLSRSNSGPVVVNGSVNRRSILRTSTTDSQGPINRLNCDASTSDEVAVDTPTSSDESSEVNFEALAGGVRSCNVDNQPISKEQSTNRRRWNRPRKHCGTVDIGGTDNQSKLPSDLLSPDTASATYDGEQSRREWDCKEKSPAATDLPDAQQGHSGIPQLSPVKEVRTPSPTKSNGQGLNANPIQGPLRSKPKGKNKQKKKSSLSTIDRGAEQTDTLADRANDSTSGTPPAPLPKPKAVGKAWQTQKKKAKHGKGFKSETEASKTNTTGGEFLPLDESLRKGG